MADGTPEEIAFVRRYIGTTEPPTDADVMQQVISAGSRELAAQWYLEAERTELRKQVPFTVPGYSQGSVAANIASIDKALADLESVTGVGSEEQTVTTGTLVRPDRCRR